MAGFSINDVRDTLRADISELITRIEQGARALASVPDLPNGEEGPSFVALGNDGHAVYGTCALVAADSLATSARCLEKLAERGEGEVRQAATHLANARRIAVTAGEAVAAMRQMLQLELEGRSDEAQWVALEWQGAAGLVLGEVASDANAPAQPPPAEAAAAPVDSRDEETPAFPFRDAVSDEEPSVATELAFEEAPEGASADDELQRELLGVFEQEAREVVVALQGHLSTVAAEPASTAPLGAIERLLHTLKGAAATIGLTAIRDDASELQHRVEEMVDSGGSVAREWIACLVGDINQMLSRANLPHVKVESASRAPEASAPDAHAAFEREAQGLLASLGDMVDALAAAQGADRDALLDRIGASLHRMRGSALVVGEDAAASDAGKLEEACAAGTATTAELARGLARITSALRITPERTTPENEAAIREVRALFLAEARQIHADAAALVKELVVDGTSVAADLSRELGALFHRLKGSAAVAAQDAIASEAAALHKTATTQVVTVATLASLRDGLARIGRLVGAEAASSAGAPVERPVRVVREAVSLPAEPELWRAFTLECNELLDALERETLDLEHSDTPKDRARSLLRHYHTLKGVVNTMGLTPTGAMVHRVEDFLEELVERPVLPAMGAVVSLLLQVQTEVRKNLRQAPSGFVESSLATIDARASRLLGASVAEERSNVPAPSELSVQTGASAGPGSNASANDGADRQFIKVATERLDVLMNLAGELVVSRSRLLSKVTELRALQTELGRGSKRLVETVETFRRENEFANLDGRQTALGGAVAVPPQSAPRTDDVSHAAAWGGFSDLELDRYDDVHVLSRSLAEITSDFQELYTQFQRGVATLTDDSDAFGGIISGIQNEVTRARMVPLEFVFARLRLPIRDAATRDGKEVRVVTRGEDVSIDKTIADALFQPMLHLVRNAVAHGIERSSVREGRGKQTGGTITLAARQESGQIVVEVRDDGAGLDLEALRERGIAMGLVAPEVPATDPSIRDLVFAPQLSTQKDAGAVAGRGVGCDVVRRSVERLNGTIRVESERGKGTAFHVTLPLTLAITKALLVRHRQQTFALPLYFAERIILAQEQRVVESAGHRRIKIDDAFVPVKTLGEILLGAPSASQDGPVVLLRVGDQRLTLQVDEVLGQEEIVVKNLGTLLAGHPLFAGVSIRGTGELVLIVDVPELVDARGTIARPSPQVNGVSRSSRPQADEAPRPLVDPPSDVQRTRPRILFVDDSLSVRKVAELNLRALDVDVTLAVDGLDALNKLREETFDLVFTDLEMPRMHGYELIRELRFLPAYADLPILVVTSRSGQKHQEQARALGATEYMTKPFTAQSLEAAIKRFAKIRGGKGGSDRSGA